MTDSVCTVGEIGPVDTPPLAKAPKVAVPVVTAPLVTLPHAITHSGGKYEGTRAKTAQFIKRVVPWPNSPEAPGYVNLHWTFWDGDEPLKNPPFGGIPTRTPEEFMKALDWAQARPNTKDIYFCLSLQAKTRTNKRGRIVAARTQDDALPLKSIWLDIDVKDPPRGYATLGEAVDALTTFRNSTNLPAPSALVFSGGGLHVYWINDKQLAPAEWQAYAEALKAAAINFGLRCDAGCTIDSARILRVPGTFNYKRLPKRPVSLRWLEPEPCPEVPESAE
jgi:hypothetical protein